MFMGVCADGGIGLAGQSAACRARRELLVEELLLGIAGVAGEEDVGLVGKQQYGTMTVSMTGSMHHQEVICQEASLLKRAEGVIQREQRWPEPAGQ